MSEDPIFRYEEPKREMPTASQWPAAIAVIVAMLCFTTIICVWLLA